MSANDTQVGGAHYKTVYQHWDMVADCHLGYFEGQVTKYLSRHALKNGLQDVEKAEHFLKKLLELAANAYPAMNAEATTVRVHRYFEANPHIGEHECGVIMAMCFWSRTKHIEPALKLIHKIKQKYADADRARQDADAQAHYEYNRNKTVAPSQEEADRRFGQPHYGHDESAEHPTPRGYVDQGKDAK